MNCTLCAKQILVWHRVAFVHFRVNNWSQPIGQSGAVQMFNLLIFFLLVCIIAMFLVHEWKRSNDMIVWNQWTILFIYSLFYHQPTEALWGDFKNCLNSVSSESDLWSSTGEHLDECWADGCQCSPLLEQQHQHVLRSDLLEQTVIFSSLTFKLLIQISLWVHVFYTWFTVLVVVQYSQFVTDKKTLFV